MWTSLVRILDGLLLLLQNWMAKREQEISQHERDKLEESPGDWFNDHFNGLSKPSHGEPQATHKANDTGNNPV